MGRKAIPTALKIVRGNPGKRPLNANEPIPEQVSPHELPPPYLSDAAREHWALVCGQLRDAQLLGRVDTHALALYCEAFARWRMANEHLAKNGPLVTSPRSGYPVQSPYLAIANKAHEQMARMLSEFGMTPASRSRVSKIEPDDDDPYKGFVKQPKRGA